jgi:hypothetical protein
MLNSGGQHSEHTPTPSIFDIFSFSFFPRAPTSNSTRCRAALSLSLSQVRAAKQAAAAERKNLAAQYWDHEKLDLERKRLAAVRAHSKRLADEEEDYEAELQREMDGDYSDEEGSTEYVSDSEEEA